MPDTIERTDDRAMELIDEYLQHLRRAGRTEATLRGRREILYRLNRMLPYGVGMTTTAELSVWLHRDGLSANSKFTYYTALKSFYGWATDPRDRWLDANPVDDMEAVKMPRGRPRPVTDEQLHRILTEADQPFRLWALLAAYEGLRAVEISRLDRQHITEDQLIVLRGKGNKPRALDTDPDVWAAVRDLPPGPVACKPDGERADETWVSIRSALHFRNRLGLPGVGLHMCRHWLGVNVQKRYKNLRVTQRMLGHSSVASTEIYTDAGDDELRAARSTLPRLAG